MSPRKGSGVGGVSSFLLHSLRLRWDLGFGFWVLAMAAASTWAVAAASSTACAGARSLQVSRIGSARGSSLAGLRLGLGQAVGVTKNANAVGVEERRRGVCTAQVAATKEAASVAAESGKLVEAPVAIVTGASRGIGKAIALALGGAGGKVREDVFASSVLIRVLV